MSSRSVQVPNISCGHCVQTIERELGAMAGVTAVDATQEGHRVTVEWEEGTTSWQQIAERLKEINYPPVAS